MYNDDDNNNNKCVRFRAWDGSTPNVWVWLWIPHTLQFC